MGGNEQAGRAAARRSRHRGIEIRRWPSGKTTIRVTFVYRGVRCRETLEIEATPGNIKYAERLRAEIQNAIERGTFDYLAYFPSSQRARLFGFAPAQTTIGKLLEEYLVIAEKTVARSTFIAYRKHVRGYLIPEFGNLKVRELTPQRIRKWVSQQTMTMKYLRNILVPLRNILNDAVTDGCIDANPIDKVELKKYLPRATAKSSYEVDPFDAKEISTILRACDGQERNLYQFAFASGLRISELIALEWRDIDFVHGLVHVSRAVVEKEQKEPKTAAGVRDVVMLPAARQALDRQRTYTYLAGGRVFCNPRTGRPWEDDQQIRKTSWTYILKRAGVRYRIPYQTRHTYASTLLSRGENPKWVSMQLGHADVSMVFRVYGKKWIPQTDDPTGYKPASDWLEIARLDDGN